VLGTTASPVPFRTIVHVPSPFAVTTVEPIVSNASSPSELDSTVSYEPWNSTSSQKPRGTSSARHQH
jgi:hypothetical protein